MCVGDALRELAGFLDGCEEESLVNAVGLVGRDGSGGARELTAEVEVTVPMCDSAGDSGVRLDAAHVHPDGRLGFTLQSIEPVVPAPEGRVSVDPTDVVLRPDGTAEVTLTASVPTDDDGQTVQSEPSTDGEPTTDGGSRTGTPDNVGPSADEPGTSTTKTRRDRDVPPFRDPELLAEVYESCETFAEMTEAIGMDVTSETVRRYMIDYGIHTPNSYNTERNTEPRAEDQVPATDEEGSPVLVTDGIGLPDDVTVETLIETVERSNTLYEVAREIGVDREDALDMLRQLNLLDLVVGRLSTEHERDICREEVVERLRQTSAAG